MARKTKPLEEQLIIAQKQLEKSEEDVRMCKQNVVNIKQQIEERDMREAYGILKQNGITIKQLQTMISKQSLSKNNKPI